MLGIHVSGESILALQIGCCKISGSTNDRLRYFMLRSKYLSEYIKWFSFRKKCVQITATDSPYNTTFSS